MHLLPSLILPYFLFAIVDGGNSDLRILAVAMWSADGMLTNHEEGTTARDAVSTGTSSSTRTSGARKAAGSWSVSTTTAVHLVDLVMQGFLPHQRSLLW